MQCNEDEYLCGCVLLNNHTLKEVLQQLIVQWSINFSMACEVQIQSALMSTCCDFEQDTVSA